MSTSVLFRAENLGFAGIIPAEFRVFFPARRNLTETELFSQL